MKRGEHHGALRQLLVETALGLLDDEGVEAVTIRATARASGVSHAAPANHFPDRRALLTAVATHIFAELRGVATAARHAAAPSARARIIAFANAYVDYALTYPNRYRMMWRMDLLDAQDAGLNAHVDGLYAEVEGDVSSLPGGKECAMTLVIALSSAVHGYASMRIDGNFIAARDEVIGVPRHEAIVGMLIDGAR